MNLYRQLVTPFTTRPTQANWNKTSTSILLKDWVTPKKRKRLFQVHTKTDSDQMEESAYVKLIQKLIKARELEVPS